MMASAPDYARLPDQTLAERIAARDPLAVGWVVEHHNQRLYRAAWSIVKDRTEAEDVVQNTYLHAFAAIGEFEGRSSLGTWLTRIAINEALQRKRTTARQKTWLDSGSVVDLGEYREKLMRGSMQGSAPDADVARAQVRAVLEGAIADLPQEFRTVFVLREIEGLTIEEIATALDIPAATVKTRNYRARQRLQQALEPDIRATLSGSFPFAGADCAAMTARILDVWCADKE